jgi:hypothetical protein
MKSTSPTTAPFARFYDAVSHKLIRRKCSGAVWTVMHLVARAPRGIRRKLLVRLSGLQESTVDAARKELRELGLVVEDTDSRGVTVHATPAEDLPHVFLLRPHAIDIDGTRATVSESRHSNVPEARRPTPRRSGTPTGSASSLIGPRRGPDQRDLERDPLHTLPDIERLLVTSGSSSGVGKVDAWLTFKSKPNETIRGALKSLGFIYDKEVRCWTAGRSDEVDAALEHAVPSMMDSARNAAFERIRCEIQGGHPDNARHFDEWPEFRDRCRKNGQEAAEAWLRDVLGPRAGAVRRHLILQRPRGFPSSPKAFSMRSTGPLFHPDRARISHRPTTRRRTVIPRYTPTDLAEQLNDRFEPDETTPRELRTIAVNVLRVAEDLRDVLDLETDDDVAIFLAEHDEGDLEDLDEDDGDEDEDLDGFDDDLDDDE